MKRTAVTIKPIKHPRYSFRVTFTQAGEYQQRYFTSKRQADEFARGKASELRINGSAVVVSPDEAAAVHELRQALEEQGLTIRKALEDALSRAIASSRSSRLHEAVAEFLDLKEGGGKAGQFQLSNYRSRLDRFVAFLPHNPLVSAITTEDCARFISSIGGAPQSRHNIRKTLSAFFHWCAAEPREWVSRNPAKTVELPDIPDADVTVLTPAEAADLMERCPIESRAVVALRLFAGIRWEEASKIDWSAVDLEKSQIEISGAVGKGKKKRVIPMSDNLRLWLMTCPNRTGRVQSDASYLRRISGLGIKLPKNVLRHCYGSYMFQLEQNTYTVSEWMGNSPAIVKKHYRSFVTAAAAAEFWAIVPGAVEEKMQKTAD